MKDFDLALRSPGGELGLSWRGCGLDWRVLGEALTLKKPVRKAAVGQG